MQMIGKMLPFLTAYHGDLEYNFGYTLDTLNHFTSGTPYFDDEAEAKQYIADLNTTIKILESEK